MKLTTKQKIFAGIASFLLILIITNPSAQAFKEYTGSSTYEGLYKDKNLFIFSIYKESKSEYIAALGNFWDITSKKIVSKQADSTAKADSNYKMSADTAMIRQTETPPLPKGFTRISEKSNK